MSNNAAVVITRLCMRLAEEELKGDLKRRTVFLASPSAILS
jgi:hypothetical protein